MVEGIQGIYQRIQEINSRIDEIRTIGARNPITQTQPVTTQNPDEAQTLGGLTFSQILQQVSEDNGGDANAFNFGSNLNLTQALSGLTESRNFYNELYTSQYASNMDNLQNIIDEASQKFGVDASLIKAVIKQESQFNPNAVSHAGAQGLMQLMPQTAELLGVTDSFDVRQNVFGGTRYLKMLLDKYNNNLPLSLAAYNAGATRVDNAGAVPAIPETQNYVLKVLQFYDDFRNL